MTEVYSPEPAGSVAPKARGHKHLYRIITWSLEGPLKVYVGCAFCSMGESISPSRLVRKIPDGFTPETWAEFLDKGDARARAFGYPTHAAFVKGLKKERLAA